MLSSNIDQGVVEAGPSLPAQMPANDRRQRRCSLVQTNGAFLGSLEARQQRHLRIVLEVA